MNYYKQLAVPGSYGSPFFGRLAAKELIGGQPSEPLDLLVNRA